jgi:hypothetical protein
MNALYQRLKELDRTDFERLCFDLLRERYPSANVRRIEGAAGDSGIDSFSGDLDARPTIWQCKSFANGIRESQKQKIRESFDTALKNFQPSRWVLCLSVDMDLASMRWFQKYASSKRNQVEIALWQASDIVLELLYRKTIRDSFFPDAILDAMEIPKAIAKTGELSDGDLAALSAENVEQYIERLRARDARFNCEVVFAPNGGIPERGAARPGLIASISDDRKVVNVFARDHEALRLDPPRLRLKLTPEGAAKLGELQRTGGLQELDHHEILGFESDMPILNTLVKSENAPVRLVARSNVSMLDPIHARVTFGSGVGSVVYEFVEFHISDVGTEVLKLSSDDSLPFKLVVTFRGEVPSAGDLNFTYSLRGRRYLDLGKFVSALDATASSGDFEIYDLKRGSRLCRLHAADLRGEILEGPLRRLIDDAVAVSEHYGVELVHVDAPVDDFDTLAWLRALIGGIEQSVRELTFSLTKTLDLPLEYEAATIRLVEPSLTVSLLNQQVDTGAMLFELENIRFAEYQRAAFRSARIGDVITMTLNPDHPARLRSAGIRGLTDVKLT